MPESDLKSIENVWLRFVHNMSEALVVQPDDRPLDQYMAFRDEVLALVKSHEFLEELKSNWPGGGSPAGSPAPANVGRIANLVLLELDSSTRAIEVVKTAQVAEDERRGWFKKMLGRGSTVTGSVQDILEHVFSNYPLLKGGLTVFRELLDLFKGD